METVKSVIDKIGFADDPSDVVPVFVIVTEPSENPPVVNTKSFSDPSTFTFGIFTVAVWTAAIV